MWRISQLELNYGEPLEFGQVTVQVFSKKPQLKRKQQVVSRYLSTVMKDDPLQMCKEDLLESKSDKNILSEIEKTMQEGDIVQISHNTLKSEIRALVTIQFLPGRD